MKQTFIPVGLGGIEETLGNQEIYQLLNVLSIANQESSNNHLQVSSV
jgi:hypothetical protein